LIQSSEIKEANQDYSTLVKIYQDADSWRTRQQILSIFAGDLTKKELMVLFICAVCIMLGNTITITRMVKCCSGIQPCSNDVLVLDHVMTDHFFAWHEQLTAFNLVGKQYFHYHVMS
jgi:hypothetical protein